jgi:hypothetical protein
MSSVTRVAVLVLFVVAVVAAFWFVVLREPPKTLSPASEAILEERRRQPPVVVPDVRGLTLVAAKSVFDQAELAWEVVGPVKGYHDNLIAMQTPPPGVRLVDTGAPLVKLRLRKSGAQEGTPQQHSPLPGTEVRVLGAPVTGLTTSTPAATTATTPPAATTAPPAVTTEPAPAQTVVSTTPAPGPTATVATGSKLFKPNPPAFVVPGAPREKRGELPLPRRAALLMTYLRAHPKATNKAVKHWLFQHAWVVQGARFGWWHGEEALVTLIKVDRQVERQWGIGYRSEAIARDALAFVRAQEAAR